MPHLASQSATGYSHLQSAAGQMTPAVATVIGSPAPPWPKPSLPSSPPIHNYLYLFINFPNGELTILSALSYCPFKKHRVPTLSPPITPLFIAVITHTLSSCNSENQNSCITLKVFVCRPICDQNVHFRAPKFPSRNLQTDQQPY